MIVTCSVLFWGCIGFIIPKKYMRIYIILASIGLSSLYFFFQPPVKYDLYRHYEVLHILRRNDLWSIMNGSFSKETEMLKSLQQGAPLYLLYAYFISLFQIDELLPVITGIIIYTSSSSIILMAAEDMDEDIADWKISFCFLFLLTMLDFRTISGLRYMMSYALFAYVLYKDLVRGARKPLCCIAYLMIANIHNSAFILIIIRLLIELNRYVPKLALMIIALSAFSSVDLVLKFLIRFNNLPMVQAIIDKMYVYGFGGGSTYNIFRVVIRFIHIVICLLLCLYCKKNIHQTKKFQKYGDVFLVYIMFAFGAIRQYDTFVRSMIFIYFTILPFLLLFLQYIVGKMPLWLNIPDSSHIGFSEVVIYFLILTAIGLSLYMYYGGYYRPMDQGIISGFRQFIL